MDLAVKTARATHTHEDAVQGAQLFALAVGHVLHQVIVSSFEVDGFLDYLQDNFQGTSYEDKLRGKWMRVNCKPGDKGFRQRRES